MQIIVDKGFNIKMVEPSMVGQGSVNGAVISIFAPFSVTQYSAVNLWVRLPNGQVLEPIPAFPIPSENIGFGAWSVAVGGSLTEIPGTVTIQLEFVSPDATPTTNSATFTVSEGVRPVPPDSLDQSTYNDLISYIGTLTNNLNDNKALSDLLLSALVGRFKLQKNADTAKYRIDVRFDYSGISFLLPIYSELGYPADELRQNLIFEACGDQPVLITDGVDPDAEIKPISIEYGTDYDQFSVSYIKPDGSIGYISFTSGEVSLSNENVIEMSAQHIAEILSEAVGMPTYDAATGKITFTRLNGTSNTIDLILMSMLTDVTYDAAAGELVFDFRTHEGQISEIRISVGALTLPVWTANINTNDPNQLDVPPTTRAVKNAIAEEALLRIGAISNEAAARQAADSTIRSNAVNMPMLNGDTLTFTDLNGAVKGSITLPSSGGGGGSCSCYSVPIQTFEYYNYNDIKPLYNKFNFTEVAENVLKAYIHVAPPVNAACGGYPEFVIYSDNPFINEGASNIYYNFDDLGDNDSEELEIFVTLNSPLYLSIRYYGYNTPPNNWFIEITAKTDTREIWVVGQAMKEAY